MRTLTLTELRQTAHGKARKGFPGSAVGVTYGQAAERALEFVGLDDDPEQFARWWVHEKLDAGAFVTADWCGEVKDLPRGVDPDLAEAVVVRAGEIWVNVVFEAFQACSSATSIQD